MSKSRLYFIDNLRIVLIALVVLHHLAITYGAPGGWYYSESEAEFPAVIPFAIFVATNQSFFMGMFFFVSAFFVVPSLRRKGIKTFVKDRLIRLGIPLLVFYFLLSPFTAYVRNHFIENRPETFLEHLQNGWGMGFGPMWFVEALLIFTAIYLLIDLSKRKIQIPFPSVSKILLAATLIGTFQFIIRIWLPVGWSFAGTNLQFPHFLQYIALFYLGIVAWQNKWMDQITTKLSWRFFAFAQVLIFIGFPLIFMVGGAEEQLEVFMGGLYWQSLAYSVWEQLLGFSLVIALLGIFRKYFNKQGGFTKKLSDSAYGVYVFHSPILLIISALFLNFEIAQLLKFIILSPVAIIGCFTFAWLVKQLPGVKSIL